MSGFQERQNFDSDADPFGVCVRGVAPRVSIYGKKTCLPPFQTVQVYNTANCWDFGTNN